MTPSQAKPRKRACAWAGDDPLMRRYHDEEWGVPVHEDRRLFEFLVLESAQAGLSWSTILRKRENYREAFAGFDPLVVSRFDARRRATLMTNAGIVRNRLKIESTVTNAKALLEIREEFGSFDRYLWGSWMGRPFRTAEPASMAFRQPLENPMRSARTSVRGASDSLDRRSYTRSCRR